MAPNNQLTLWLLLGIGLLAPPASANRVEDFLGWSADGSFYGKKSENDGTAQMDVALCLSDPGKRPASWPKELKQPAPGDACAWGECDEEGNCRDSDKRLAAVTRQVKRPPGAKAGPHGETLGVKGRDVLLITGGKRATLRTFEADDDILSGGATLRLGKTYWRADGGAVACEVLGHGRSVVAGLLPAAAGGGAAGGKEASGGWSDFTGFSPTAEAEVVPAAAAAALRPLLAKIPGAHDKDCDASESKQGRVLVLKARITGERPGVETAVASLGDGLGIFDGQGALVAATGDNFGCTLGGASQDMLQRIGLGQLVPDDEQELVVEYASGGRAAFTQDIQVLKRRGKALVPIFAAILTESKDGVTREGKLSLDGSGAIRYQAPGRPSPRTFRWDAAAFRFK